MNITCIYLCTWHDCCCVVVVIKERIKVLKIPLRTMPFSVENLLFLVMRCFLIAGKKQTTENYNVASYHDFRILLCCSLGMHVVLRVCTSQKTKCYKHQTTKDTGNNVCRRIFSFNFLSFIFSFSLADFFQVLKSYRVWYFWYCY